MSQKTSIEIIKEYAKVLGGLLVSTGYTNNKETLKWKCNCGEECLKIKLIKFNIIL